MSVLVTCCLTCLASFVPVLVTCGLTCLFFLCVSVGELWLERPLETAMLLSLVGVASVVSNQWHCQLADNKHKLDTYLTGELLYKTHFTPIIHFLFIFNLIKQGSND